MHLFYTPDITPDTYTLSEEESRHCIKVLRLQIGDKINLIDGIGGFYEAEIIADHQKRCTVKIMDTKKDVGKRSWNLHIAIAPTKNNDRLEWFTEKATEMGIKEISLIDCQNSERTIAKTERLNKVAIAAIKQSLKAYLPVINEVMDFKKFITSSQDFTGQKFIAHCHALPSAKATEALVAPHLKNLYIKKSDALILIGPEGDFTTDEVKLAADNGFQAINLGTSRLRTETAALYACSTINILNE